MSTTDRTLACVLVLLVAATSHAAPADRAEELFQRARELMDANDFVTACPLLEEVVSLDQGVGAQLALALCHEGAGRPATALREFRAALPRALAAQRADRIELVQSHIHALERSVPRIVLQMTPPEPTAFTIALDDAPVERSAFVDGAPVDPGSHQLVVTVPGRPAWRTTVLVTDHARVVSVPVPCLLGARACHPRASWPRTLGFTASGVGVAAIGVGVYFGVAAARARDRSAALCVGTRCSAEGVRENEAARRDALGADVTIGIGGAALVTGAILLVHWYRGEPPDDAVAAWSDGRSVGVMASW